MYSSKLTSNKEESTKLSSASVKSNLKIVIENETMESSSSSSLPDEANTNSSSINSKNEQVSEISEEDDAIEVDVDNNEIEFHVNLDKVPPTLQNTILNEKIYLNESIKESNPPEDLNEISDENLKAIYESLGITEADFMLDSSQTDLINSKLFDKKKLHLYGTDELSTSDIFEYFKDYKPVAVEWINDSSCNVIWKNETHAANALLGMSIPFETSNETNESKTDTSLDGSSPAKSKIINLKNRKFQFMPPKEIKWRKGVCSVKGYQIYMRYMRQMDHKRKGAESRSEYYRKYGNPNFGNLKGIISQSARERMKTEQISSAHSDLDDQTSSTTRRSLIAYELDDYAQNNLEEFGTNKSINDSNLTSERKRDREKKLRLYSDDLVKKNDEGNESSDEKTSSKMRSDQTGQKRKNRFEPYESSKFKRSNKRYDEDEEENEGDNDRDNSYRKKRDFDRLRDRYRFSKNPNDLRNKLNSFRN